MNWSDQTRLLLTVGLCGGFTTFSTFSNECLVFVREGRWGVFSLYVAASIALGIAAVQFRELTPHIARLVQICYNLRRHVC